MIELYIHVVPPEDESSDGRVFVTHIFRGNTEAEAREVFAQHAKGCEFLTPAIAEGRIEEEIAKLSDKDWVAFEPEGGEAEDEELEVDEDDPEDEEDDLDEEE